MANHKLVQEECNCTKMNVIGAQRRSEIHSEFWELSAMEQQFIFSTIKNCQKREQQWKQIPAENVPTVIYYLRD